MNARMLGDHWVVLSWTSEIDGNPIDSLSILGYDPSKQKYVGTWVDTVTRHKWNYVGTLENQSIVLFAEGPSCSEEDKKTEYRETYKFAEGKITHTSESKHAGGEWREYMKGNYVQK